MASPRMVLGWMVKRLPDLLVVLVLAVIGGEVYLRSPLGRQPEFVPDAELGARLRPDQVTQRGRLNSDGHRGPETDWSQPVLVGIGDSNAYGEGVADHEVWTAHVAQATGWQVVNAAHPAFGPSKQAVLLERVLERGGAGVRGVLIRVSISNAGFKHLSGETLTEVQRRTESLGRLRAWSHLIPALKKKVSEQWPAIAAVFGQKPGSRTARHREEQLAQEMWQEHSPHWRDMVEQCERLRVPVLFFVHDPTDLPSNRLLQQRLEAMAQGRSLVSVVRLDSTAWELRPGTTEQMNAQFLDRYTLHWDPHGNAEYHAVVGRFLARELQRRGIVPSETVVASNR